MTKFFMIALPPLVVGEALRFSKRLVGNTRVTCDTLARMAGRSKYTGKRLREIRADGRHR